MTSVKAGPAWHETISGINAGLGNNEEAGQKNLINDSPILGFVVVVETKDCSDQAHSDSDSGLREAYK